MKCSDICFPYISLFFFFSLFVTEFPAFLDYYRQIRDADPAYASKCNAHWRLFMQGPPNRPNRDECGLIHVVCHFFKNCDQGIY